jgi:general secretion pathway protein C
MHFSLVRTEVAHAAAITAVNIAALALLALTGAYWTWQWFAPRAEPPLPAQVDQGGQIAAALELFGAIKREDIAPVSTGNAIRLLGVVAANEGRDAYAIVVLDGKQIIATRRGDDIVPGLRLAEVAPDHVVLDRNGVRESLALPEKPPSAENGTQRANR